MICKSKGLLKASLLFPVASVLAFILIWVCAYPQIDALDSKFRLLRLICDAIFLTIPYWIVRARARWIMLVEVWAVALWTLISLCYFRFWHKLPELFTVLLFSNFDNTLFRSGVKHLHALDIAYFIIPALLTMLWIARRRKIMAKNISRKIRLIAALSSLGLFIFIQCVNIHLQCTWMKGTVNDASYKKAIQVYYINNLNATTEIYTIGAPMYVIKTLYKAPKLLNMHKKLSDAEIRSINQFISQTPIQQSLCDSLESLNSGKNLVLFIVESLNSNVIGLTVNGHELTPTLNSLVHQPGTISALNIRPQVGAGGSGDGQLLINTGLHPVPSISTYNYYGNINSFPSIARTLQGYSNAAIFADNGQIWNETNSSINQGFQHVYAQPDYQPMVNKYGADGALMRFGLQTIDRMRKPWFVEMLTSSMHTPFDDPDVPHTAIPQWIDPKQELPSLDRGYLEMVNYFDTELGKFIAGLKKRGLYDRTVLVIVSDHTQDVTTNTGKELHMAFIAANTGLTATITRSAGEVDIYPTILQIMGKYSTAAWPGAGISLLDERLNSSVDASGATYGTPHSDLLPRQREAYTVSHLILRGNYFKAGR